MPKNRMPLKGSINPRLQKEFLSFISKSVKANRQLSGVTALGEVFLDETDMQSTFKITKRRMHNLSSKGLLRPYKMNAKSYYKESDLYRLMQTGLHNSAA